MSDREQLLGMVGNPPQSFPSNPLRLGAGLLGVCPEQRSESTIAIKSAFQEARVKQALNKTKNAGLQPALDYLIAHNDDPEPTGDEEMEEPNEESEEANIKRLEGEGEAKVCPIEYVKPYLLAHRLLDYIICSH